MKWLFGIAAIGLLVWLAVHVMEWQSWNDDDMDGWGV